MTPERASYLYQIASRLKKTAILPTPIPGVRDDATILFDELAIELVQSQMDREDRAKPADAEWFAGLPGVTCSNGWAACLDGWQDDLVTCELSSGRFLAYGSNWPGGPPTRGQVLDAMAALGGKGGDA